MRIAECNAPVAKNIAEVIENKGLKQIYIAKKAGYSPQEFNDMLNGRRLIKVNDIARISSALDVDVKSHRDILAEHPPDEKASIEFRRKPYQSYTVTDYLRKMGVSSYASSAKSASEVNGHTVDADVPSDAKFTDTTYTEFQGTEGTHDGVAGLVPAPKKSEFGNSYGLGSDGTWRDFGQTFVSQSFAEEAYVTNEALENAIKELKKYVGTQSPGGVTLDSVYPVGSIYISVNDNFDPNKVFPGTWVSFGKGRTLVGVDTSDPEFQSSEDTGGEKTHVLTVDELPEHNHDVTVENKELTGGVWNFVGQNAKFGPGNSTSGVFSKGGDGTCFYPSSTGKAVGVNDGFMLNATHDHTATSGNTGSGTAHNNMMPYITVRMWKRTWTNFELTSN